MCRLAAYCGPPVALERVVTDPDHSLVVQSMQSAEAKMCVHGDGFGLAWYGDRAEPGLYRDLRPAWSDENLASICRSVASPLFLAHVRAATDGEVARANCHPFAHGTWSFAHNGRIGGFDRIRRRLEARLPDDLYLARRGSTDSELLFLLMLAEGLNEVPDAALRAALAAVSDVSIAKGLTPFHRLTCVFTNGETLYACRSASDRRSPTLYVCERSDSGGVVIASEPLGGAASRWRLLDEDVLHRFPRPQPSHVQPPDSAFLTHLPASCAQ